MCKCTFDKGDKCVALTTHECENCVFRKTKDELLAGRRRARARLEDLPEEQQDAIRKKYYGRNNTTYEL